MKIALVHDWLNGMRGGEKVLEVLCDVFPDASLYALFYEPDRVSEKIRRMNPRASILQRFPAPRRHYRHYLPLYPWAIRRFDMSPYDVVISSSHCAAKGVRLGARQLHICYCHAPMRYIWEQFDAYFGGKNRWRPASLAMMLCRGPLQRWDVATARRVNHFIANSEAVAHRIARYYGREATVVYPPADTERFRILDFGFSILDCGMKNAASEANADNQNPSQRYLKLQRTRRESRKSEGTDSSIQNPKSKIQNSTNRILRTNVQESNAYFLIVAALVPYKRIELAIEAVGRTGRVLWIVGEGPERRRLERLAGPSVCFLGWVSDDELVKLYNGCRALLFPGEEDFGITAVEAQACGRPVIALRKGGVLETVLERRTGLFFDEPTVGSLCESLEIFERTVFDRHVIRAHAESFGVDRCRRELETTIRGMLEPHGI
jgi:glycosyltransferase involved in cell wall biosynthesis